LRIEVVNGKKHICYCIFSVYLVTGTKNPDISEEGTFRISKLFFYITTRYSKRWPNLIFGTLSLDSHRLPGSSALFGGGWDRNIIYQEPGDHPAMSADDSGPVIGNVGVKIQLYTIIIIMSVAIDTYQLESNSRDP
jgi:hypothetical protein